MTHEQMHFVYESLTYTLSLGVMGEMGSTMVGVFTPFLLDRAPPVEGKGKWDMTWTEMEGEYHGKGMRGG